MAVACVVFVAVGVEVVADFVAVAVSVAAGATVVVVVVVVGVAHAPASALFSGPRLVMWLILLLAPGESGIPIACAAAVIILPMYVLFVCREA